MQLRPSTSARPELLVDTRSGRVSDQVSQQNQIGVPGPFGRGRCMQALPMAALWLSRNKYVHDEDGFFVGDAEGNVLGFPGVIVHRLLGARWVEDTRRLAG